jgi:hypothetical protein
MVPAKGTAAQGQAVSGPAKPPTVSSPINLSPDRSAKVAAADFGLVAAEGA